MLSMARKRIVASGVALVLVLTTMLYASQSLNMPFVQMAFADTLHFGQMEQPAYEGRTLGDMVESQLEGTAEQAKIEALVAVAQEQVGKGYARGGRGPDAFDCSGLVQYCAREALGMELPRTSYAQSTCGTDVALEDARRGDLLFWGSPGSSHHVGIYLGDGAYIHAAGSGKGVVVATFDYYAPTYARRVI
ncbi:C40 family peptidase [Adlercreutzia murintestinalis]|uniref:C40 family peptidase n=1 Tax=Adlercreutzia murintestinalis TaxID=2941325 RepID=UPI00203D1C65|nr:C40 family peptidase [Adlercreutzia murintestinalis]